MATVKELRAQAKARKIPKYYRLSKPQLMSALGVTSKGDDRARSTAKQHGIAKTYAADKLSSKLGGSDEAKRVAIKQRIVKSVSKELKAHAKKIGRKLTIEEKRSVAVKALSKEVKSIRSGMPEQGGKAKQPTPDTAKMYAYRDRYLAKKAEKEKAEKAPKHGSAPFQRRKGGAKSPALDKVAADTGMTREEVAKAVKRKSAKAKAETKPKDPQAYDGSDYAGGRIEDMTIKTTGQGRTGSKFISSNQSSSPDHLKEISDHMKSSGKNVTPVFVHKTAENRYKALENGHIAEAAKKGGHDFTQTIVVEKKHHAALKAEHAVKSEVLDPSKVSQSAKEQDNQDAGSVARSRKIGGTPQLGEDRGVTQRTGTKFITSRAKSSATPEQLQEISDHMKANGKNITPVFVRKTGDNKYEAVHNAHILEAAKKGKHDFVHTIVLDEKMHKQLQAEQKH